MPSGNPGPAITAKPAFHAIGMRWEGTFGQAGEGAIREIQALMKSRLGEIPHRTQPDQLLGLSYPTQEDRLTHYALVEVAQVGTLPEGMVTLTLPEQQYVTYHHGCGEDINDSYRQVGAYMEAQGLRQPGDVTAHLEIYPMGQDPYTDCPEFVIMMPVSLN